MTQINQLSNKNTNKTAALLVATLTSFLTPFLISSVNVALKDIGNEFSLSAVLMAWVSTSYLLTSALCLIPVGRIADIKGRKKVFFWGLGLMAVSSVLCAAAPNGFLLIFFRGFQGAGAALLYATNVAILSSVFPAGERGRVLGINSGAIYLGVSLGPTLGGFLVNQLGWRSIFWITVLLCLASYSIARWKLEGEWADSAGERFDWIGALIFGLSLAGIMMGFPRLPGLTGIGLILVGSAGLVVFQRWEKKATSPLLNLELFRNNRVFLYSNVAALINYSSVAATGFLLSLYLQYIKGMSPSQAGLILVAQPVMMVALSPIAGRLSDRIEVQIIATLGMALSTLALISFIFLDAQTDIRVIILSLVILGTGYGLFISPNTNAIMGAVHARFYGVSSSIMGTMRLIGQTLSISIATVFFTIYLGQAPITPAVFPQFLASLKPMYMIFSVLSFLGIFASLARGNAQNTKTE